MDDIIVWLGVIAILYFTAYSLYVLGEKNVKTEVDLKAPDYEGHIVFTPDEDDEEDDK